MSGRTVEEYEPVDKRAAAEMNQLYLLAFGEDDDMNLRRKPNSTAGVGSGPAAERRRGNVPASDEPKRLLDSRLRCGIPDGWRGSQA